MTGGPLGRKLVIVGAYGSGKTEFALNLAKQMAANESLVLVDLDIVNPYFRSRDATELLESLGVEVVYNRDFRDADLPALSARTDTVVAGTETVIIDVGGDDGARVLGRYKAHLIKNQAEIWMVVNCFRPFTADAAGIISTARRIEAKSGLKITALVNNSNLGRETTAEHVRQGAAIVSEAAGQMGVQVPYHCCRPPFISQLPEFKDKLFAMELSLFPADIT
ncbi:MAG: ATP-binding protein [Eubacteriales bacterium]|nr:ATP-binding protein [Eubacteriales bacterium]MDD3072962.1 ATP-binding protein [Eubacteriales bacterium]MDD4078492.1 ATP-binding protein [Eubacteriales bacterium]MDD4768376.1 ATP-binding protein [Eubacteriales bacterium]